MPANELGMMVANQLLGAGMGAINDKRQLAQQGALNQQQVAAQKDLMQANLRNQMALWDATNYSAQKQQMEKAGLNPALMYGMSGGGGATAAAGTGGSVSGGSAQQNPGEMAMALNLQLLRAQKENIEADTKNKQADATLKGGAQTENIKADTALKVLDQIVKDYTGKELKSQYENVDEPNRTLQQIANADELAQRSNTAKVLADLAAEGKLRDKNLAEIESIVISNSKSREETKNIQKQFDILEENLKGAKLDNIIKDLETKLQTETGIDSKSPAWLKILGRLFVQLTK